MSIRVIVCGGRDFGRICVLPWDKTQRKESKLNEILVDGMIEALALVDEAAAGKGRITLVHGAARGADSFAEKVGEALLWWVERHPADWNTLGKKAGPVRNQKMVDLGADLLVAFPGGNGTADMEQRAGAAWIPVWRPFSGQSMPEWLPNGCK